MIENNHFKKTYTINIDINLDKCNFDAEWAQEDLECGGQLYELSWEIRKDLEQELHELKRRE